MKIVILGAGPAGLYCGLLIKKANPTYTITIIERNPADVTYGWGVVFSDRTLSAFQRADYKTYEQIVNHFVIWDAIDVHYRNETMRCGGHIIASISRKLLLHILQERCAELGIILRFNHDLHDLSGLDEHDLLIAADGINSTVRKLYTAHFQPRITLGKAKYIWLGAQKVLDAFTFIFRQNEHGLFQVHAYPFSGTTSTFIVECDETTWLHAGLDTADEATSLTYAQQLLADDLCGAPLLSNNAKWTNFPTLKTKTWHHQRIVLLGDSAHTAHFSIGSGTKLAMEDAIALASALEQYVDMETALNEYELERKPIVELFQKAAQESQTYFETIKRYLGLESMQFTFQLLTRSGRVSYADLKLRDTRFGDTVDRWWSQKNAITTSSTPSQQSPVLAPPPMFAALQLRSLTLPNRVVLSPSSCYSVSDGTPNEEYLCQMNNHALRGAGLIMTSVTAISREGRITPDCTGMYDATHVVAWSNLVEFIHTRTSAKIALRLGHAGRRGSTRPRTTGLDRPLRAGNWSLLSASCIPYTVHSQVPQETDKADMNRVRDMFVHATQMAQEANFDLLQLHFAHGYLMASFLSPLSNHRVDAYSGNLENRLRFPLEVFDAVRATWPQAKPIALALTADDCAKGGISIEDVISIAKVFKEHGCDLIEILAGHTTVESEPAYNRGFLSALSDQVRNNAAMPTLVGGYLTNSNDINTILAAGRADLCIMFP